MNDGWSAAVAVVVTASCVVVPLYHSTTQSDAFALPKAQAMWVLVVAAAVAAVLGATARNDRLQIPLDRITWIALGFAVLIVVSWFFSVDRPTSLRGERLQYQGLLSMLSYPALFLLTRSVFTTPARFRQLCWAVTVGAMAVAGVALLERFGLDPRPFPPIGRVYSTIGQPNWLAAYLVVVIPVALALAWSHTSTATRRTIAGVTGLLIAGVVWTLSRAGYIGLAAAAVVLLGLYWRRMRRWPIAEIAAVALVSGALVALVPTNNSRDSASASAADSGLSTPGSTVVAGLHRRSDHVSLWRVGLAIVADHPIVGTGPDTYAIMFPAYRDKVLDVDTATHLAKFRPESPHNVYIATASGSGLFALAALGLLIFLVGQSAVARSLHGDSPTAWPLAAGVAAALAGHLVTEMFMTQEVAGSLVFWVIAGAAVASDQPQSDAGIDLRGASLSSEHYA
jgi:putative inorganic carbon (HCO3(-)) transporter